MQSTTYLRRRGQLKTYFDATALDAWARLTSSAPVGRIRATVRAGRERMRATLLEYLPADLHGARVLDAGCGTGALAVEAARRGAEVLAIDLSPALITLARSRQPELATGRIQFEVGDMLDSALGRFDHVIAMDSLIHYGVNDVARALATLAARTERSILFTIAPRTPLLMAMWTVGRLFPRGNRAPALEPVSTEALAASMAHEPALAGWRIARTQRIVSGFYTSQAVELTRA